MEPDIESDWHLFKPDTYEEIPSTGNLIRSWQCRELGINPPHSPPNKTVLENIAEDILVQKTLNIKSCDLPGYPRSTFLMVFSPDGTKVASTHGNHNVYVSELSSGKHVRILQGHPRTPWCIAFHPSHSELIGSGCLGGQVRVWDIASGGSEVWNAANETVIASIAFHPREQLLVIATSNELYFWDWSQPAPFTKVCTNNIREKVRYVAFDSLGYKLITGISLWKSSVLTNSQQETERTIPSSNQTGDRGNDSNDIPPGGSQQQNPAPGSAQDMIYMNSYQNLVQRYDNLVRNYQRLFMAGHRLTNTPSYPSTIDRGTDPMETDPHSTPDTNINSNASSSRNDSANSTRDTSRQQESGESTDEEDNNSRVLNLDVLTFEPSGSQETLEEDPISIVSRPSAFQPLNDNSGRSFRTIDQNERTRLLPNPFSSSNSGAPRVPRVIHANNPPYVNNVAGSSRTSVFISSRTDPLLQPGLTTTRSSENLTDPHFLQTPLNRIRYFDSNIPSTSRDTTARRPNTTNSATQMSPLSGVDAQSINESLDLIRDILRDSGTRLLNLITDMSLSTLANAERNLPQRESDSRTQSDDGGSSSRSRTSRTRGRLFNSSAARFFLTSSSDSDSDLEVDILRTRNSRFQEGNQRDANAASTSTSHLPSDRIVFDLTAENESNLASEGGVSVSVSNDRFHIRTNENSASDVNTNSSERRTSAENQSQSNSDFSRPSTSRDNLWPEGQVFSSDEAYRRVRAGVNALQERTTILTNMWLRGTPVTTRELRLLWSSWQRRIVSLQRDTVTDFSRSLYDRCMMLTGMADDINRTTRTSRNTQGSRQNNDEEEHDDHNLNESSSLDEGREASDILNDDVTHSLSSRSSNQTPFLDTRTSPSVETPIQPFSRWRPEHDLRRRSQIPHRLYERYRHQNRSRRDLTQAIEISGTKHEIRMRAMQILSVMFNTMMMCLDERGLNQLIITMLRSLKKALALTCLMLMTNRNNSRTPTNTPAPDLPGSENLTENQNVENNESVDENSSSHNTIFQCIVECLNNINETFSNDTPSNCDESTRSENSPSRSSKNVKKRENISQDKRLSSQRTPTQRWSHRLAVQIAAANRNYSVTARRRRELYLEGRRLKALYTTNPTKHPLIRTRVTPPISTHRIPALRHFPSGKRIAKSSTPLVAPINNEPVAGPSHRPVNPVRIPTENVEEESSELLYELERRVQLQLHAARLRNAARWRRFQTIRLYTPGSYRVRETFSVQAQNSDAQPGNRSRLQSLSESGRRLIAIYRRLIPSYHLPGTQREEERRTPAQEFLRFQPVINESTDGQQQSNSRMPRVHEYLQPIILAQNSMLPEEDNESGERAGGSNDGGGPPPLGRMEGVNIFDAGFISEAFVAAPSHRIQAWDFTNGNTPNIADTKKNIVVQRCRIHNDASIDISKDGRLLVAVLPAPRLRRGGHWLGIYSLEWSRLGQCLHTAVLEQSAVSVAFSPTARHLAVGLGSRRFSTALNPRNTVFALLYRLDLLENSSRTGLSPIKELDQNWELGFTSLNCLRWAPIPGQGLVYANNTGQLIIMS